MRPVGLAIPSLAIALVLAATVVVAAQDVPAIEIGAGYSALRDNDIDHWFGTGVTVDIGVNVTDWLAVAGEGSYHSTSIDWGFGDVDLSVSTFMGGMRFLTRRGGVSPFVQALVGVARQSFNGISMNAFAVQPGAGVDVFVTRKVAVRLQGDFRSIYDSEGDDWDGQVRLMTGVGIVLK